MKPPLLLKTMLACLASAGASPPNGWIKIIAAGGTVGPNLESSQKYCYLWPAGASSHGRRHHRSGDMPSF